MGRTILVVDDDPAICRLLSERLSQEGYDCRSCLSGEAALELIDRETPDVIISDLGMRGISGLELLEKARKKSPLSAFLIITGLADVRVGVEAMKQGAADYLLKPLQLDAVTLSVERALERKRLELEVENYRQHLEQMVEKRTEQLQMATRLIEKTYDDTLEALGAALDLRDDETAGHSRRVNRYCLEMAGALGFSGEDLRHISRGAHLHDIGKIGIPDAILLKPGKLSEEERKVMESHPEIGYAVVNRITFLAPAAEMVLTHQERYDGSGYPQGLAADHIPLESRIFAVADTLDAMTSDRPYRSAQSFSDARDEITRESSHQFDPEVVRLFLSIPEHIWEKIRQEFSSRSKHSSGSRGRSAGFSFPPNIPEN